jgi:hypothetical protein
MAHVAQALFILFIVAGGLLLIRAGGSVFRILYTRPLVLWAATAVVIPGLLIWTGRWRSVDAKGILHFVIVAVVAFAALTIFCEGYRILKGTSPRR